MTGEEGSRRAAVALPLPAKAPFIYEVPDHLAVRIVLGGRVRVPLGRRRMIGTVVAWPCSDPLPEGVGLKPIEAVLDDGPVLAPELLELTRFVAGYYLCSWGEAIESALPPAPPPPRRARGVRRSVGADASSIPRRAVAQRRALERLPGDGSVAPLDSFNASLRRTIGLLVRRGLAAWIDLPERVERPATVAHPVPAILDPTPAQEAALARILPAIRDGGYAPFLLFGATGSGKTEVYLRAAEAALTIGKGVIYLVPEIGLTPLLVARIRGRFSDRLAVLHSAMSVRDRHRSWEQVRRGEARLVVGARSALFAPVPDLGLIVVDEEQDASYKQSETPRYNARDLAVVRARDAAATLVMGSATPSLESFHHARTGRYELIRLGGRVEDRPLPTVRIVDMRLEYRRAGRIRPLSAALEQALRDGLSRGEQALVLRNRRGWAAALLCPACGRRISCDRCSVALTWHKAADRLRCHWCGLDRRRPPSCPSCGAETLSAVGEGTERIEVELAKALPGARIARMDRDTVRRRGAHEALLRRFDRGEIDVLVGTQMIAKGHDFPRVTVVGVLSADQTLGLPDFRAAERTFQLLTQVAGRAGRGKAPGLVVIQAYDAAHPVLPAAASQDYESFFEREVAYRRALRYPPLTAVVELLVEDRDAGRAASWAGILAAAARRRGGDKVVVSGPVPAPVERVRGRWRFQVLVRSAGRRRMVDLVAAALEETAGMVPRRAVTVDVDPLSVL